MKKNAILLCVDKLNLEKETNNFCISAEFSDNADVRLSEYVKVKEKVDVIKL